MIKSGTRQVDHLKIKKMKSPGRAKGDALTKRKSVSRDRYF